MLRGPNLKISKIFIAEVFLQIVDTLRTFLIFITATNTNIRCFIYHDIFASFVSVRNAFQSINKI